MQRAKQQAAAAAKASAGLGPASVLGLCEEPCVVRNEVFSSAEPYSAELHVCTSTELSATLRDLTMPVSLQGVM